MHQQNELVLEPGAKSQPRSRSRLGYDKWREYEAKDTHRFYALRLHEGGMIWVESAVGRGSTFRVVLPVYVEPALEEAA